MRFYAGAEICAHCRYFKENTVNNKGQAVCDYDSSKKLVYATDEPPKNCFWKKTFTWDGDRAIELCEKYRGFYIITAIYNKLNKTNSPELNLLYKYKAYYISKNDNILSKDYDIFGPRIAKLIELNDKNGVLSKKLYNFYVLGMLRSIKSGNLKEAKELFEAMYLRLKDELIIKPMMLNGKDKQQSKKLVLKKN